MPTCLPLVVPGRRQEHEIPSGKFAPFAQRLVDKNEKEKKANFFNPVFGRGNNNLKIQPFGCFPCIRDRECKFLYQ